MGVFNKYLLNIEEIESVWCKKDLLNVSFFFFD